MKKRILTIITVMLVALTSLTGCQNIMTSDSSIKTTEYENAVPDSDESTTDEAIEEKKEEIKNNTTTTVLENTQDTTETAQDNSSSSNVSSTNAANSNTTSSTSTQTQASTSTSTSSTESSDGIILVKSQHGFTLELPKSWDGKYIIDEDPTTLTIIFKTDEDVVGYPWLLQITKTKIYSDGELDPGYDPIVSEPKIFTVGNTQFYVAGPTGLTLSDTDPDFDTYIKMASDRTQIINSIKVTN